MPPELSGKNGGKRRKRWTGPHADYSRALVTQMACDLQTPPTGVGIARAINKSMAEALGIPEIANSRTSRSNKWQAHLRAKTLLPPRVVEGLIETGSPEFRLLARNDFWVVYKTPLKGGYEFRQWINKLIPHSPPITVRPLSAFALPKPGSRLIRALDRRDSLKTLAAAMLTYGAAYERYSHEPYALKTCAAAFARVLRIVCRISCVAPFAGFRDEFVENVIGSMVTEFHYVPMDWRTISKQTMDDYRLVIRMGRESGFLTYSDKFPQGRNNEELAALRFADEVGYQQLCLAFDVFAKNKRRLPVLCGRLRSQFMRSASNLYI